MIGSCFDKLEFSSHNDNFFQVWLKFSKLFKERLQSLQCTCNLNYISLLGKGRDPLVEQPWIPFTLGSCVPGLVAILAQRF